jgi:hypothetical protein
MAKVKWQKAKLKSGSGFLSSFCHLLFDLLFRRSSAVTCLLNGG